jgi:tRNA (cmo5U34)-methyltransferase
MEKKDNVFAGNIEKIVDFKFDEKVANVFEDMLRRSIPGYGTIITVTGMFAEKYAQPRTNIYDLGTSLGASALAMQQRIKTEGCKIFAVDNSKAMIERAKRFIDNSKHRTPIELVLADVRNVNIHNASIVVLNLTLQFIKPSEREALIKKIYDGMVKNGILILTEKVTFSDTALNSRQSERYYDFKAFMGYSQLEISRKRDALENVMILDSLETHYERLRKVGFRHFDKWFQVFNFISIIAQK